MAAVAVLAVVAAVVAAMTVAAQIINNDSATNNDGQGQGQGQRQYCINSNTIISMNNN